jgi:hypothetical protein
MVHPPRTVGALVPLGAAGTGNPPAHSLLAQEQRVVARACLCGVTPDVHLPHGGVRQVQRRAVELPHGFVGQQPADLAGLPDPSADSNLSAAWRARPAVLEPHPLVTSSTASTPGAHLKIGLYKVTAGAAL